MLINFCLRVIRVEEEEGEGEEVDNDDFFQFVICVIFLYDHVCPLIISYFILD